MGKNIKETLISALRNGEKALESIEVLREVSEDKISDVSVTAAAEAIHRKMLDLVVSAVIHPCEDYCIIRFSSADGYLPPFEAGQYINIFVETGGIRTSRPYSISSSPGQRGYYEITVARAKNGFVSEFLIDCVKVGDRFEANGPAGSFHYQPVFHSRKSLFLAGGSGVTPFISMIREIVGFALDRDIVMLYGFRNFSSAVYHEELESYARDYENIRYYPVISDKTSDCKYEEKGYIDAERIKRLVPDFAERTCYICGPEAMNVFCVKELRGLGVPQRNIRREMFGAVSDITLEQGWPADIPSDRIFNIKIGDRNISAKAGEPILVALEKAGIRVNVCCRSGECGFCRVKLVSGHVFVARGTLNRLADTEFGYIHSCKSFPLSDIEIML